MDSFINKTNNETIQEKYYRLSYLYLINPDTIITEIRYSGQYKSIENTKDKNISFTDSINFFSYLYETILTATKNYNCIFTLNNTPILESLNAKSYSLVTEKQKALYQCIKNHCIIRGYLNTINTLTSEEHTNVPNLNKPTKKLTKTEKKDKDKSIKLSYPNHSYTEFGYNEMPKFINNNKTAEDNTTLPKTKEQTYNQNMKAIRNTYIDHALASLSTGKEGNYYLIPKYYKHVGHFLFNNISAKKYSCDLSKVVSNETFIYHYSKLKAEITSSINALNDNRDKLIFHTALEVLFGCKTTENIYKYINTSHLSNLDANKITPNDIISAIDINDWKKLLKYPSVITQDMLFYYATNTITTMNKIEDVYLITENTQESNNLIPDTTSKNDSIYKSSVLLRNYFSQINNTTLPIINDLWDVIMFFLFENIDDQQKLYDSYINHNYEKLVFSPVTMFNQLDIIEQTSSSILSNLNNVILDLNSIKYTHKSINEIIHTLANIFNVEFHNNFPINEYIYIYDDIYNSCTHLSLKYTTSLLNKFNASDLSNIPLEKLTQSEKDLFICIKNLLHISNINSTKLSNIYNSKELPISCDNKLSTIYHSYTMICYYICAIYENQYTENIPKNQLDNALNDLKRLMSIMVEKITTLINNPNCEKFLKPGNKNYDKHYNKLLFYNKKLKYFSKIIENPNPNYIVDIFNKIYNIFCSKTLKQSLDSSLTTLNNIKSSIIDTYNSDLEAITLLTDSLRKTLSFTRRLSYTDYYTKDYLQDIISPLTTSIELLRLLQEYFKIDNIKNNIPKLNISSDKSFTIIKRLINNLKNECHDKDLLYNSFHYMLKLSDEIHIALENNKKTQKLSINYLNDVNKILENIIESLFFEYYSMKANSPSPIIDKINDAITNVYSHINNLTSYMETYLPALSNSSFINNANANDITRTNLKMSKTELETLSSILRATHTTNRFNTTKESLRDRITNLSYIKYDFGESKESERKQKKFLLNRARELKNYFSNNLED